MTSISDFKDLNLLFHADKWLEENFGCEFYHKRGGFLNSSCPFEDHPDTSPSFGINTDKGFFKCFGCGREGSLIKLVQLLLNINYYQAINVIAAYENINTENYDSISAKNEKFKRIIQEDEAESQKYKRLVEKVSGKIKRKLKNNFEEADDLYRKLDELVEKSDIKLIKEMLDGIK